MDRPEMDSEGFLRFNSATRSGNRKPYLYFAKDGETYKFMGEDIPEVCKVAKKRNYSNGSCSGLTFKLDVSVDCAMITFMSPKLGWAKETGLWSSWERVFKFFSADISVETVKAIVRNEFPAVANRLDANIHSNSSMNNDSCKDVIIPHNWTYGTGGGYPRGIRVG